MSETFAIRVMKLGKRYSLHRRKALPGSLAASFGRLLKRAVGVLPPADALGSDDGAFWAIQDLSFDVKAGEVFGIIGHNGAGKSTLLKLLSRVTEPSSGRAELLGRVGALLEVGTGFHPELTGRENVYLNGSILGMRRHEIQQKFSEIVEFAGVEKFIDTPVKHYSSGMRVRLGFAVAAYLDPEILIIDEVLAVGDAEFQRRCLSRMEGVGKSGRTVLIVSHNLPMIRHLCQRALLLEKGQIKSLGPVDDVVNDYVQSIRSTESGKKVFEPKPEQSFQVLEAEVADAEALIEVRLRCVSRRPVPGLYGYLTLQSPDGSIILESDSADRLPNPLDRLTEGDYRVLWQIQRSFLAPGSYKVYISFSSPMGDGKSPGVGVDVPGIVAELRIDDHETRRGNSRKGYFGAVGSWEAKRERS